MLIGRVHLVSLDGARSDPRLGGESMPSAEEAYNLTNSSYVFE